MKLFIRIKLQFGMFCRITYLCIFMSNSFDGLKVFHLTFHWNFNLALDLESHKIIMRMGSEFNGGQFSPLLRTSTASFESKSKLLFSLICKLYVVKHLYNYSSPIVNVGSSLKQDLTISTLHLPQLSNLTRMVSLRIELEKPLAMPWERA